MKIIFYSFDSPYKFSQDNKHNMWKQDFLKKVVQSIQVIAVQVSRPELDVQDTQKTGEN